MQRREAEPNGIDEDWESVMIDSTSPSADSQLQTQTSAIPLQFGDMQVSHPSDCDVDANALIHQFNCLGTTDKDVLVSQLQKFIGPSLHKHAAQFFLDMNDWNLQRAIGSYFDLTTDEQQNDWGNPENGRVLQNYSAATVESPSGNQITVSTNVKFSVAWKVMNDGAQQWPPGTHLKLRNNQSTMAFTEKVFLQSPSGVPPGEIRDVIIELTSPPQPGSYELNYTFTTPEGFSFGREISLVINVIPDETVDLSLQFQNLHWNNGSDGNNSTPNVEMS